MKKIINKIFSNKIIDLTTENQTKQSQINKDTPNMFQNTDSSNCYDFKNVHFEFASFIPILNKIYVKSKFHKQATPQCNNYQNVK